MKKYRVILHPEAETDITSSFEWGCRTWGQDKATIWLQRLRRTIKDRLSLTPLRCPLAPESKELNVSIRQLISGRYRILFVVEKRTVTILHVSGAYQRHSPWMTKPAQK